MILLEKIQLGIFKMSKKITFAKNDRDNLFESRSDTPRSSGWVRWKAENFLLNLKKNPDENIFSSWRILILKKYFFTFLKIFSKIFEKYKFSKKIQ